MKFVGGRDGRSRGDGPGLQMEVEVVQKWVTEKEGRMVEEIGK